MIVDKSKLMKNKSIISEVISTDYREQEATDENKLNTLPECEIEAQVT
jgi:hypothetical protein